MKSVYFNTQLKLIDPEAFFAQRLTIGKNLRFIRRRLRKESINFVAKLVGISYAYLCKIENGQANYSLDVFFSICKYYQINPVELFNEKFPEQYHLPEIKKRKRKPKP